MRAPKSKPGLGYGANHDQPCRSHSALRHRSLTNRNPQESNSDRCGEGEYSLPEQMTLRPEFAVVLLSNLRAAAGTVGLLLCAYAIWKILQTWELRGRQNLTIWWIVLVPVGGTCFWLLGRWSRIPILAILLVVVFLLVRLMAKRR